MDRTEIPLFTSMTQGVRRLFHRLANAAGQLHAGTSITPGMRAIMENLTDSGPQTVPAMARIRPVSRQHIQKQVDSLLADGLVRCRENPAHKRSRLVELTPQGKRAFSSIRLREAHALSALDLDLTAEELAVADKVVHRLIEKFSGPEWDRIVSDIHQKEKETEDDQHENP